MENIYNLSSALNYSMAYKMFMMFLTLALGAKILEYKFGRDYGDKFYDYSGQGRHGTSGDGLKQYKVKSTDRGVYIQNTVNYVSIPNFSFPPIYSIYLWLSPKSAGGDIFYIKFGSTQYTLLYKKLGTNRIKIQAYTINGNRDNGGANIIYDSWNFIGFIYNSNQAFVCYLNGKNTFSLSASYSSSTSTSIILGSIDPTSFALESFVWYLSIEDTSYNDISYLKLGLSTICIIPASGCSCTELIIDLDLGTGCLPSVFDPLLDSLGATCGSSNYGCISGTKLYCTSTFICVYDASSRLCKLRDTSTTPVTNSTVPCTCEPGYIPYPLSCTISDCKTYDANNDCITCKAANAEVVSGRCSCKIGYFGTPLLLSSSSCTKCPLICASCISLTSCSVCVSYAELVGSMCKCMAGYTWSGSECIQCLPKCLDCSSTTTCTTCRDVLSETSSGTCQCPSPYNPEPGSTGLCECPKGFYIDLSSTICSACQANCETCSSISKCDSCILANMFGDLCETCHISCGACKGTQEYDCTNCTDSSELFGYCIKNCPIGYLEIYNKCELLNENGIIFDLKFASVAELNLETVNGFEFEVVDEDEIFLSYLRGVYFRGNGYMGLELNETLMFNNFLVSVWVNPYSDTGEIFSFGYLTGVRFLYEMVSFQELLIDSSVIAFRDSTFDETSDVRHGNLVRLKEWNHISIKLEHLSSNTLTLSLNSKNKLITISSNQSYTFPENSSLILVCNSQKSNFFKGFIYSFEIYSKSPFNTLNLQTSACLQSCKICPYSGTCIPNCNYNEFYIETTDKCEDCSDYCKTGCLNYQSCSLCADKKCLSCTDFELNSCVECEIGYQVINSSCSICQDFEFYDENNKTCVLCPDLCTSCQSYDYCIDCIEKSEIDEKTGICKCIQGYEENNSSCVRVYFSAKCWISSENEIFIIFDYNLAHDLSTKQVLVLVNKEKIGLSVNKEDSKTYKLTLDFQVKDIETFASVYFVKEILDSENRLFDNSSFTKKLAVNKVDSQEVATWQKANESKVLAGKMLTAQTAAVISFSVMSMDPSSLYDFLNTAEIFYSVYLFNLNLNPILSEFLLGYRVQSYIPNIFEYMINKKNGVILPKKLKKFGYESNLVLINLGPQLQTLAFFLFIWVLFCILSKMVKNKIVNRIKEKFKFNIFLRLWIQIFLESILACYFSIFYTKLENITQIVDFSFSVLLLVRVM